jgi:DNA-binding winged helix-turn-helix (wHTH) protein
LQDPQKAVSKMDGSRLLDTSASETYDPAGEICFRTCRLAPGSRVLLRDGAPVDLGSRAFDLLHVLVRARGSVVSKREIVDHVWPNTIVEESNLRFQVGALRKALGPDRDLIKTVPGRGYLFVLESPQAPGAAPSRGAGADTAGASRVPTLGVVPQAFAQRADPSARLLARLAESQEACAALLLLRAVLDELWAMAAEPELRDRGAPSAIAEAIL